MTKRKKVHQGRVLCLVFRRSVFENTAINTCKGLGILNLVSDARNTFFLTLKEGLSFEEVEAVMDKLRVNSRIKFVCLMS